MRMCWDVLSLLLLLLLFPDVSIGMKLMTIQEEGISACGMNDVIYISSAKGLVRNFPTRQSETPDQVVDDGCIVTGETFSAICGDDHVDALQQTNKNITSPACVAGLGFNTTIEGAFYIPRDGLPSPNSDYTASAYFGQTFYNDSFETFTLMSFNRFSLFVEGTVISCRDGYQNTTTISYSPPYNTLQFYSCSRTFFRDRHLFSMFVNGNLIDTKEIIPSFETTSTPMLQGLIGPVPGQINFIRIFDRALSLLDIQRLTQCSGNAPSDAIYCDHRRGLIFMSSSNPGVCKIRVFDPGMNTYSSCMSKDELGYDEMIDKLYGEKVIDSLFSKIGISDSGFEVVRTEKGNGRTAVIADYRPASITGLAMSFLDSDILVTLSTGAVYQLTDVLTPTTFEETIIYGNPTPEKDSFFDLSDWLDSKQTLVGANPAAVIASLYVSSEGPDQLENCALHCSGRQFCLGILYEAYTNFCILVQSLGGVPSVSSQSDSDFIFYENPEFGGETFPTTYPEDTLELYQSSLFPGRLSFIPDSVCHLSETIYLLGKGRLHEISENKISIIGNTYFGYGTMTCVHPALIYIAVSSDGCVHQYNISSSDSEVVFGTCGITTTNATVGLFKGSNTTVAPISSITSTFSGNNLFIVTPQSDSIYLLNTITGDAHDLLLTANTSGNVTFTSASYIGGLHDSIVLYSGTINSHFGSSFWILDSASDPSSGYLYLVEIPLDSIRAPTGFPSSSAFGGLISGSSTRGAFFLDFENRVRIISTKHNIISPIVSQYQKSSGETSLLVIGRSGVSGTIIELKVPQSSLQLSGESTMEITTIEGGGIFSEFHLNLWIRIDNTIGVNSTEIVKQSGGLLLFATADFLRIRFNEKHQSIKLSPTTLISDGLWHYITIIWTRSTGLVICFIDNRQQLGGVVRLFDDSFVTHSASPIKIRSCCTHASDGKLIIETTREVVFSAAHIEIMLKKTSGIKSGIFAPLNGNLKLWEWGADNTMIPTSFEKYATVRYPADAQWTPGPTVIRPAVSEINYELLQGRSFWIEKSGPCGTAAINPLGGIRSYVEINDQDVVGFNFWLYLKKASTQVRFMEINIQSLASPLTVVMKRKPDMQSVEISLHLPEGGYCSFGFVPIGSWGLLSMEISLFYNKIKFSYNDVEFTTCRFSSQFVVQTSTTQCTVSICSLPGLLAGISEYGFFSSAATQNLYTCIHPLKAFTNKHFQGVAGAEKNDLDIMTLNSSRKQYVFKSGWIPPGGMVDSYAMGGWFYPSKGMKNSESTLIKLESSTRRDIWSEEKPKTDNITDGHVVKMIPFKRVHSVTVSVSVLRIISWDVPIVEWFDSSSSTDSVFQIALSPIWYNPATELILHIENPYNYHTKVVTADVDVGPNNYPTSLFSSLHPTLLSEMSEFPIPGSYTFFITVAGMFPSKQNIIAAHNEDEPKSRMIISLQCDSDASRCCIIVETLNGETSDCSQSRMIAAGVETHISILWNPSQYVTIFINGQSYARSLLVPPTGVSLSRILVGAALYSDSVFKGIISDLRMFRSMLSLYQIRSISERFHEIIPRLQIKNSNGTITTCDSQISRRRYNVTSDVMRIQSSWGTGVTSYAKLTFLGRELSCSCPVVISQVDGGLLNSVRSLRKIQSCTTTNIHMSSKYISETTSEFPVADEVFSLIKKQTLRDVEYEFSDSRGRNLICNDPTHTYEWEHLLLSVNTSMVSLYKNGQLLCFQKQNLISSSSNPPLVSLYVGGSPSGGFFEGKIAYLEIYWSDIHSLNNIISNHPNDVVKVYGLNGVSQIELLFDINNFTDFFHSEKNNITWSAGPKLLNTDGDLCLVTRKLFYCSFEDYLKEAKSKFSVIRDVTSTSSGIVFDQDTSKLSGFLSTYSSERGFTFHVTLTVYEPTYSHAVIDEHRVLFTLFSEGVITGSRSLCICVSESGIGYYIAISTDVGIQGPSPQMTLFNFGIKQQIYITIDSDGFTQIFKSEDQTVLWEGLISNATSTWQFGPESSVVSLPNEGYTSELHSNCGNVKTSLSPTSISSSYLIASIDDCKKVCSGESLCAGFVYIFNGTLANRCYFRTDTSRATVHESRACFTRSRVPGNYASPPSMLLESISIYDSPLPLHCLDTTTDRHSQFSPSSILIDVDFSEEFSPEAGAVKSTVSDHVLIHSGELRDSYLEISNTPFIGLQSSCSKLDVDLTYEVSSVDRYVYHTEEVSLLNVTMREGEILLIRVYAENLMSGTAVVGIELNGIEIEISPNKKVHTATAPATYDCDRDCKLTLVRKGGDRSHGKVVVKSIELCAGHHSQNISSACSPWGCTCNGLSKYIFNSFSCLMDNIVASTWYDHAGCQISFFDTFETEKRCQKTRLGSDFTFFFNIYATSKLAEIDTVGNCSVAYHVYQTDTTEEVGVFSIDLCFTDRSYPDRGLYIQTSHNMIETETWYDSSSCLVPVASWTHIGIQISDFHRKLFLNGALVYENIRPLRSRSLPIFLSSSMRFFTGNYSSSNTIRIQQISIIDLHLSDALMRSAAVSRSLAVLSDIPCSMCERATSSIPAPDFFENFNSYWYSNPWARLSSGPTSSVLSGQSLRLGEQPQQFNTASDFSKLQGGQTISFWIKVQRYSSRESTQTRGTTTIVCEELACSHIDINSIYMNTRTSNSEECERLCSHSMECSAAFFSPIRLSCTLSREKTSKPTIDFGTGFIKISGKTQTVCTAEQQKCGMGVADSYLGSQILTKVESVSRCRVLCIKSQFRCAVGTFIEYQQQDGGDCFLYSDVIENRNHFSEISGRHKGQATTFMTPSTEQSEIVIVKTDAIMISMTRPFSDQLTLSVGHNGTEHVGTMRVDESPLKINQWSHVVLIISVDSLSNTISDMSLIIDGSWISTPDFVSLIGLKYKIIKPNSEWLFATSPRHEVVVDDLILYNKYLTIDSAINIYRGYFSVNPTYKKTGLNTVSWSLSAGTQQWHLNDKLIRTCNAVEGYLPSFSGAIIPTKVVKNIRIQRGRSSSRKSNSVVHSNAKNEFLEEINNQITDNTRGDNLCGGCSRDCNSICHVVVYSYEKIKFIDRPLTTIGNPITDKGCIDATCLMSNRGSFARLHWKSEFEKSTFQPHYITFITWVYPITVVSGVLVSFDSEGIVLIAQPFNDKLRLCLNSCCSILEISSQEWSLVGFSLYRSGRVTMVINKERFEPVCSKIIIGSPDDVFLLKSYKSHRSSVVIEPLPCLLDNTLISSIEVSESTLQSLLETYDENKCFSIHNSDQNGYSPLGRPSYLIPSEGYSCSEVIQETRNVLLSTQVNSKEGILISLTLDKFPGCTLLCGKGRDNKITNCPDEIGFNSFSINELWVHCALRLTTDDVLKLSISGKGSFTGFEHESFFSCGDGIVNSPVELCDGGDFCDPYLCAVSNENYIYTSDLIDVRFRPPAALSVTFSHFTSSNPGPVTFFASYSGNCSDGIQHNKITTNNIGEGTLLFLFDNALIKLPQGRTQKTFICLQQYEKTAPSDFISVKTFLIHGCNTCLNEGFCNILTGTCTCPTGYTGATCSVSIDGCTVAPSDSLCKARGEYSAPLYSDTGSGLLHMKYSLRDCNEAKCGNCFGPGMCKCPPGFAPPLCENCLSGYNGVNCTVLTCDCLHGVCKKSGLGEVVYCKCDSGWEGVSCDRSINIFGQLSPSGVDASADGRQLHIDKTIPFITLLLSTPSSTLDIQEIKYSFHGENVRVGMCLLLEEHSSMKPIGSDHYSWSLQLSNSMNSSAWHGGVKINIGLFIQNSSVTMRYNPYFKRLSFSRLDAPHSVVLPFRDVCHNGYFECAPCASLPGGSFFKML